MTLRLARIARDNWRSVDGEAASRNLPGLPTLPLDRFCSFVWWWATRHAENDSQVRKFETQLWRPPEGEEPRGPWAPAQEQGALEAFKRSLTGAQG